MVASVLAGCRHLEADELGSLKLEPRAQPLGFRECLMVPLAVLNPDVLTLLLQAGSEILGAPEARKLAAQAEQNAQRRHEESKSAADARHQELLTIGKEQLETLASDLELQTEQLEMSREGLRLQQRIAAQQDAHFSIQTKQAWAIFRQTPEGQYYRAWETAAFQLLGVVSARDKALSEALSTEAGRLNAELRDAVFAEPEIQEESLIELKEVSQPEVPDQSSCMKPTERARRAIRNATAVGLTLVVILFGVVGFAVASGMSVLYSWLADKTAPSWALLLSWWGWVLLILGVMVTWAVLLAIVTRGHDEREFDRDQFVIAEASYAKLLRAYRDAQERNALIAKKNAEISDSLARSRAEREAVRRMFELRVAAMQNELAAVQEFDWMENPEQGRAAIKEIIQTAARGRIEHPEPAELPRLELPRLRPASDGPTPNLVIVLQRLNTDGPEDNPIGGEAFIGQ